MFGENKRDLTPPLLHARGCRMSPSGGWDSAIFTAQPKKYFFFEGVVSNANPHDNGVGVRLPQSFGLATDLQQVDGPYSIHRGAVCCLSPSDEW